MPVYVWKDDDQAYIDWATRHQGDGWIASVYHSLRPGYFRVHRASHKLVYAPFVGQQATSYTGNQFAKVTADSLAELWIWADANEFSPTAGCFCRTCCRDASPPEDVMPTEDASTLDARVASLLCSKSVQRPAGASRPGTMESTSIRHSRSPAVKAWVLARANGVCESCGSAAPFVDSTGRPFLEVHHIDRLADGGADSPVNTAAVCPNCHRALHFGLNAERQGKDLSAFVRKREADLPSEIRVTLQ